ncbi:hypothetical protein [Sneathiella sp.]|uniref:hypothetical protein n=1 Tax=Sneathiella sp. TaxID=1964365 RepID=UPI00260ADC5F|nr:hypothetical protein [Sneathiella sp.]MDF2365644.1 hypothetical protein [Sneathiella sp.]
MTSSREFNRIAAGKTAKYPPPFSLRLTYEERARLECDAAGRTLSAYIREKLFGDTVSRRRVKGRNPIKDHEALGRVLGALGGSRLSSNLNQLAKAVNSGSLPVTPDTEKDLQEACKAIEAIRIDLMRALGNRPEPKP